MHYSNTYKRHTDVNSTDPFVSSQPFSRVHSSTKGLLGRLAFVCKLCKSNLWRLSSSWLELQLSLRPRYKTKGKSLFLKRRAEKWAKKVIHSLHQFYCTSNICISNWPFKGFLSFQFKSGIYNVKGAWTCPGKPWLKKSLTEALCFESLDSNAGLQGVAFGGGWDGQLWICVWQ